MLRGIFVSIVILLSFDCFAKQPIWLEHIKLEAPRTQKMGPFTLGDKYSKAQRARLELAKKNLNNRIRIATYNILFDIYDGSTEASHKWNARLPRVVETIRAISPDLIGLQEPQIGQLADLKKHLENEYDFYSINQALNKVDPKNKFADCILIRKGRFKIKQETFFYVSSTPYIPSKFSEAAFPTVNHAIDLEDKKTGKMLRIINSHFYFFSADIRAASIEAIDADTCCRYPQVWVGDFNLLMPMPEVDTPFADGGYLLEKFRKKGFLDSMEQSMFGHIGPLATFSNSAQNPKQPFSGEGITGQRLDRIFVTKQVNVLLHGIYTRLFDGKYSSDHFPVIADILL